MRRRRIPRFGHGDLPDGWVAISLPLQPLCMHWRRAKVCTKHRSPTHAPSSPCPETRAPLCHAQPVS